MKKVLIICFTALLTPLMAQRYTISGFVKDANTGEELIGATIFCQGTTYGTITNVYGWYSLTLPAGEQEVHYSFVGFEDKIIKINLQKNVKQDLELHEAATNLEAVVISAEAEDRNVSSAEMSTRDISMKEIKSIPVLFGEQDILKTIQLMPGIQATGEGSSGFYVRGGGPDQNMIILDEAPVYNASHLLGFFSVFNADAIKNAQIITGGIPAEYGGRVSSVLDIQMKEGNQKEYNVSGGLGLISSRLNVQGPIVKDKGSFIITGRRTYADLLLKGLSNDFDDMSLYFYDINAKANYRLGQNDRIYISGYFGRDVFKFNEMMGIDWGNATGTLRWNHVFNDQLFLNSSIIFSDYNYVIGISQGDLSVDIKSGIRDYNLKEDFHYYLNPQNIIKFGGNIIYHTFKPGELNSNDESFINTIILDKKYGLETGLYLSNEQKISPSFKVNYGLRYSTFSQIGPGTTYSYNDENTIIDSSSFSNGQFIKTYHGLEPRISASYMFNGKNSVKASYMRTNQYLHMLSNSTSGTPTDIWIPSSKIVQPQICDQIAVGYFRNYMDNKIETSVELYYKKLNNQIDYEPGADLLLNKDVESQLVFGEGKAYGMELMVKKKYGKLSGWVSYTLSRSEKQFSELNEGNWFPSKYDRTHDISIVGTYAWNEKWNVSATWIYYTGNAVTFPIGKYEIDDQPVFLYGDRNSNRMPDYHRMDVSINYESSRTKKYRSSWNLSVYNVYGRKNAYTITFRESETTPGQLDAIKLSLFSIVPSITYNFEF